MSDSQRTAEQVGLPGGDFRLFIQKLGYQALICLGVLDNPVTGERTVNPEGTRSVLEDLQMLREKTRDNLEPEEEEHLNQILLQIEQHMQAAANAASEMSSPDTE